MRAAIVLLDEFRRHGIELWTDGDQLRYRAPAGALTPELAVQLRERKAELIHYLACGNRDVIVHVPDQAHYEVSHAQRRIWVLSQIDAASTAYTIPLRLVLDGCLDRDALAGSLAQLVARHEALRTTFTEVEGEPRQVVHPPGVPHLREMDFSGEHHPEEQVRAFAEAEAAEPFDLEKGPLLRVSLARVSSTRHVLLFTIHHIVGDGWSIRVIMKDLTSLYEATVNRVPPDLTRLELQYRDYAVWQNRTLQSGKIRDQRQYWLQKLSGELPALDLPLDFVRPPFQSFRGGAFAVRFDAFTTRKMRDLARSHRCSIFTVLVALIKVLLFRYTGQNDVIVGIAVAGRSQVTLEDQVGCYLNTLPLRDCINADASFDTVVRHCRQTVLEALDHQDYPFDHLINELKLARDLSRAPLFDVMMVSQSGKGLVNARIGSLRVSHLPQDSNTSKFDLTFDCEEGTDFVHLGIEYNADLFSEARIVRMGEHLQTLLAAALREPTHPVCSLPLLSENEWTTLIRRRNETMVKTDRRTVVERITDTVRRVPGHTAIVCGDRSLTFAELDDQARTIARHLRANGMVRGDVVGVMVERSPDLVAALLGVFYAGAAYLPLDGLYPAERLAAMLEDSGARLVISDPTLRDLLPRGAFAVLCLDDRLQGAPEQPAPLNPPAWDDLAYLIYTSGSTGSPKGVQVPHSALANFLQSMELEPGLREEDVLVAITTVCFDIAALELFLPLCVGAKLVIATRPAVVDGHRLLQLIQNSGATVLQGTPATWRLLIAAGWERCPKLRVLCGGEALSQELARQLVVRAREVWNLYGPTETTIWSAVRRIDPAPSQDTRVPAAEPIGHPIANTALYALDEWLSPAPTGVPAELYIGGNGVVRGYWKRPALTAEKFLPDPFSTVPGSRMYRTGDLVRTSVDKTYEFLGRRDHQVKIRGFRIELGDVESALRAHPEITEAVVTARTDPTGDLTLAAYFVSDTGQEPAGIRDFLAQRLPAHMMPAAYICLPELPLTPNGKINRGALPTPALEASRIAVPVFPRTTVEKYLATLWQEVLGTENPGIHDNFFELGGHSLRATKIIASVRRDLGVPLNLRDLFNKPTIAELAALIGTVEPAEGSPRQSRQIGKAKPLPATQESTRIISLQPELLSDLDL
jgi:amino acid adenylation domain-containing protein